MVDYPDLSNLSSNPNIGNLFSLPNAAYPYYWGWIFFSLWLIIASSLYFKEKDRIGKGKILSSMATASLAIIILSLVGTIVGFITLEIMTIELVFNLLIIGIWFFSK